MNREDLVEILRTSIAIVTFTKVNGDLRKMKCTLQEDFLPELVGSNHKRNLDVLPVWEIDVGWRSFRIDSIISVEK